MITVTIDVNTYGGPPQRFAEWFMLMLLRGGVRLLPTVQRPTWDELYRALAEPYIIASDFDTQAITINQWLPEEGELPWFFQQATPRILIAER